jgi:hypothetical protein
MSHSHFNDKIRINKTRPEKMKKNRKREHFLFMLPIFLSGPLGLGQRQTTPVAS